MTLSHTTTVTRETAGDQSDVFNHIAPIDLTTIFTGYGLLPAVVGVRDQTGAWDAAGQTRTVTLSDGSSAQESLTKYESPDSFGYNRRRLHGRPRLARRLSKRLMAIRAYAFRGNADYVAIYIQRQITGGFAHTFHYHACAVARVYGQRIETRFGAI